MRRIAIKPRADWRPGLRKYPFGSAALGAGALWREDCVYRFSASQIDMIESVADEVYALVLDAVRQVVDGDHLAGFGIDGAAARLIETSWQSHWSAGMFADRSGLLVGRLTFAHDGRDGMRLLEVNFDGPSGLFAASIIQGNWRDALSPEADQFNALHEALVERWEELAIASEPPVTGPLHLSCLAGDPMRQGEMAYLAGAAEQAGIAVRHTPLDHVGWDGRFFRDDEGGVIEWLYKGCSWQLLADTSFATHARNSPVRIIEPAWGGLASNHGLLALLSHRHPRHPNLCRATTEPATLSGAERVVARAFSGMEHAVTHYFVEGEAVWASSDVPITGPAVWFEAPPTFVEDDVTAVVDAWIVGGKCLGMSIREAAGPFVGAISAHVPHVYLP